MMLNLRMIANNIIFKVIFIIIIISLILTNIGNYSIISDSNYIAKVNGYKINTDQFKRLLSYEYMRLQKKMGDQYFDTTSSKHYLNDISHQLLERLVNEILINCYIDQIGLSVSDNQLRNFILSTQEFQTDGKFDSNRYILAIKNMGISTDQYVQALYNKLILQQLIESVFSTDFLLEEEINELSELIAQKRIIREAPIDINVLAVKQQVNDNEINNYYEQHKDDFVVPEQFRVSYIKLNKSNIQKKVSNKEIQSYYDQNLKEFLQPQKNHYSIIQTKTKNDAKEILNELKRGMDFSLLAKNKSTDAFSSKNGGNLGWMEDTNVPDELKNARLKNKGQISKVIKSRYGYLIVSLDDVDPAKVKPLNEVKNDIIKKIKQKEILESYHMLQQKVNYAANLNKKSLINAEQIAGVKAIETGWFGRDNLPEDLNFKSVINILFKDKLSNKNELLFSNFNTINIDNDHSLVMRVIAHKSESIKPLLEVKDKIITLIKRDKAMLQSKLDIDKILLDLNFGRENEVLSALGTSFGPQKTLYRTENLISKKVFTLALPLKNKPSYGIVNDDHGNLVLLALDKVITGKMIDTQKKVLIHNMFINNIQAVFESLINNLRKKAKIIVNDKLEVY